MIINRIEIVVNAWILEPVGVGLAVVMIAFGFVGAVPTFRALLDPQPTRLVRARWADRLAGRSARDRHHLFAPPARSITRRSTGRTQTRCAIASSRAMSAVTGNNEPASTSRGSVIAAVAVLFMATLRGCATRLFAVPPRGAPSSEVTAGCGDILRHPGPP
jgi:hypothetical protein